MPTTWNFSLLLFAHSLRLGLVQEMNLVGGLIRHEWSHGASPMLP